MNNVSVCIYTNLTHTYTQLLDRRNKAPTHHTHNPYTYTYMYIVMDGRNSAPTLHTHKPYTYTELMDAPTFILYSSFHNLYIPAKVFGAL